MNSLSSSFDLALGKIPRKPETFAVAAVDLLLRTALTQRVSDIHLVPQADRTLQMYWRIDGVLTPIARFDELAANVVARLKVLADLLTYRSDIPQEGRIRTGSDESEMRVSTFPTIHGEKAVVRLFVASGQFRFVEDLGFQAPIELQLRQILGQTAGVLIIAGPAGAGKTTTLYAGLRTILRDTDHLRSICTLEDPVEALIPGAAQSQVKPGTEFTYQRGLASLMRQDPNVIMVGEIRDAETAAIVFQASLTGQLVLTSFHAGTAAASLSRLGDMGIEPYVIRSGLQSILAQRLLRRCCPCQQHSKDSTASDCPNCHGSGYYGRLVLAELLPTDSPELAQAILTRQSAQVLEQCAIDGGMQPLWDAATQAVSDGLTTQLECHRVLGVARQAQ